MKIKTTIAMLFIASLTTGCSTTDIPDSEQAAPERVVLNAYDVPFTSSDVETSNVDVEILGSVSAISEEQYFISENPDLGTEDAVYFRIVTVDVTQAKDDDAAKQERFLIHSDLNPTNDLSQLGIGDTVVVYGNEANSAWTGEPLRVPELLALVNFAEGTMTSLKPSDQSQLPLPSWVEQ